MTDADREQYGGPEWLDFHASLAWLDDQPYAKLVDLEEQLQNDLKGTIPPDEDVTLLWVIYQLLGKLKYAQRLPMIRARLWLALLGSGVDIRLDDFQPHAYGAIWEKPAKEEKPGPPAGTPESSDTSTLTPAASPASEPSTSASTPGPGEATE